MKTIVESKHVDGGRLTGSVTDSVSGAPFGQFALMRIDPRPDVVP